MLYFKTVGFCSPNREKSEEFVSIPKIEWKETEDDREFAILQVIEYDKLDNSLIPIEGASSYHYVWRFKGQPRGYAKGKLFAERPYVAKEATDVPLESVESEEAPA